MIDARELERMAVELHTAASDWCKSVAGSQALEAAALAIGAALDAEEEHSALVREQEREA